VCVIGLGGSGLAAVLEARLLGARVIGIDAARVAGAAAGRNGGLLLGGMAPFHHDVATTFGVPHATALYRHTLAELERMRAVSPEHCWWPGSLRIAQDAEELADCERQLARMQSDRLPVEWYRGEEGEGLLFPRDGACHPVRRVLALAHYAELEGAQLAEHTRVAHIESGTVHLTNGARVLASHILVCTDGALASLIPSLAPRTRSVRLQMLATSPTRDVHIPRPVYARYGYDYWQQLADGRVLFGGGRDQFEASEYTASDEPTEQLQRWMETRLREATGTRADITHRWAATVSFSHDDLPIAEQAAPGIWAAGSYSGTGNVVGALCARGIARRALGHSDRFLDALDACRA
jgi:glycine/D-amino acid oxidase-like deaminating enzyme